MKRFLLVVFTIALFVTNMTCAGAKTSNSFVDKTIAGIVIGEDSEEKVIRYYGTGTLVQKGFAWCYHSKDENQYIIFELGPDKIITGITLTSEYTSDCEEMKGKGKKDLITLKGIQLGESRSKIVGIYGTPAKEEIRDGILIYEYHTDFKNDPQVRLYYDAYLYFKHDKLIKLFIHDGE